MENECGFFQTTVPDKKHMALVHHKMKHFSCDQCSCSFDKKGHLKRHTFIKHSGEKPFNCKQCDFSCKRFDSLKILKSTTSPNYENLAGL